VADQTISVNITATGEELKREIEASISALNRLQAATIVTNKAGVATAREAITAEREYMESINASSDSMNRLDQLQQRFEQRVESSVTQQTRGLNSIARGFSVIESSSRASVRSIDAISNATAQLAFGFGPTGILIGAVVMVGIAIVRAFEKSADAVAKLREKTEEEFVKLGESLNAEAAHQDFERAQKAFDAQAAQVARLQKASDALKNGTKLDSFADAFKALIPGKLAGAKSELGELNVQANKFYELWQEFSKLTPMSELKKEAKEMETALQKQMKLLGEYTAKYGGDAIEAGFNNGKSVFGSRKPSSLNVPGADISDDVMKIKPPTIDKAEFQTELNMLKAFSAGFKDVSDSSKLMQAVTGSAFNALLGSIGGLAGGAKAMKHALLEPIAVWLRATAVKEFVAGLADLANPFMSQYAAAHFLAAGEATAGFAVVQALAGGGGGSGGGGGGSGGGSGGSNATSLGAGAGASQGPTKMEITFIQKTPDGREIARMRQAFQRQTDLAQPIRVTM
jgi:hypothetical protein